MSALPEGTVVGYHYTILRLLGEGGFGRVYSVRSQTATKPLALKVLNQRVQFGTAESDRVRREAFVADSIAKRTLHVPRVHDGGIDPTLQQAWFVMDQLDGSSLALLIERRANNSGVGLSLPEAFTVLRGVADALRAAHAQDLVHCDLKPENIFLAHSSDPESWCMPYVLDFGVAKLRTDRHKHSTSTAHGTLPWMAPELLSGGEITPAVDQWAFAQVVYWMIVGERFPPTEVQRSTPVRWAMGRGVLLPSAFDQWFDRATRSAPNERFASVGDAFAMLTRLLQTEQRSPVPPAQATQLMQPIPASQAMQSTQPMQLAQSPAGLEHPAQHASASPNRPANSPKIIAAPAGLQRSHSRAVAAVIGIVAIVGLGFAGSSLWSYVRSSETLPGSTGSAASRAFQTPSTRGQTPTPEPTASDFAPLRPETPLALAFDRWKGFVENLGDSGNAADVYLPVAKLRTFGSRDSSRFREWWHAWVDQRSTFLVDRESAVFRTREFRAGDDGACQFRGPVFEVRVSVHESLGPRGEAAVHEQPYNQLEGWYTVRFVSDSTEIRVCHENWRRRDFCPGHELAIDCRRYVPGSDGPL